MPSFASNAARLTIIHDRTAGAAPKVSKGNDWRRKPVPHHELPTGAPDRRSGPARCCGWDAIFSEAGENGVYSETAFGGKARAKNAQCATLVVRAPRPTMPKMKIVKPHAVRRSLRARMTGSLDPTRHTDGEDNARGSEPFQSSMQAPGRAQGFVAQLEEVALRRGTLAIWGRCGRLQPA